MNSLLNKTQAFVPDTAVFLQNCRDFTARFPEQAASLKLQTDTYALQCLRALPSEYQLIQTRTDKNLPTLLVHSTYLHSQYNPREESRRILQTEFFQTREIHSCCIFAGLGLGYLPEQYINSFPDSHAVLIEPDTAAFLCFLASRSLSRIFQHPHLSILAGVPPEKVMSFLVTITWNKRILFVHTASAGIQKDWYTLFSRLTEQDCLKMSTNAATLERFGMLWLKNTVKNINILSKAAKITCFKNTFSETPAVVLAGGPSLTAHLELIKNSEQHFLIIAVDTALRACLRAEIYPDFILSFDPQYWNYLHTADLDTGHSILISEASVFPAILRQPCRALFLADSSVPFARNLECSQHSKQGPIREAGEDCILAAGGSVATTAWDFARYIGANPIIMAGLDLAYPNKQTHFTGSTFEEAVHTRSSRISPAEEANVKSLIEAYPTLHADYNGGMVLTDRRMMLYAWWFENALRKYPAAKTYNLMPQGVAIPGLPAYSAADFAQLTHSSPLREVIAARLERITATAYSADFIHGEAARKSRITKALAVLTQEAAALAAQAAQAESLSRCLIESYSSSTDSFAGDSGTDHLAKTHSEQGISGNLSNDDSADSTTDTRSVSSRKKPEDVAQYRAALMKELDSIDKRIAQSFAKEFISVLFFNNYKDEKDQPGDNIVKSLVATQKTYQRIQQLAESVHKVCARSSLLQNL